MCGDAEIVKEMTTNKTSAKEEACFSYIETDPLYKLVNQRHKNTLIVGFNKGFDAGQASIVGVIDKALFLKYLNIQPSSSGDLIIISKILNGEFDVKGDL
jgi:hypothetical protein